MPLGANSLQSMCNMLFKIYYVFANNNPFSGSLIYAAFVNLSAEQAACRCAIFLTSFKVLPPVYVNMDNIFSAPSGTICK